MNRRAFLTGCAAAPLPLFAKRFDSENTSSSASRLTGFLPDSEQVNSAYHAGGNSEATSDSPAEAELDIDLEHQDPKLKFEAVHFTEKPYVIPTKYFEQQFGIYHRDDHLIGDISVQAHTVPSESRTSRVITQLREEFANYPVYPMINSQPTDWVDTTSIKKVVNNRQWSGQWMRYPQVEKWSDQRLSTSKPFAEAVVVGYATEWGVIVVDAEQHDIKKSGLLRERAESILKSILVTTSGRELIDPDKSLREQRAEHQPGLGHLLDEDAAKTFP